MRPYCIYVPIHRHCIVVKLMGRICACGTSALTTRRGTLSFCCYVSLFLMNFTVFQELGGRYILRWHNPMIN